MDHAQQGPAYLLSLIIYNVYLYICISSNFYDVRQNLLEAFAFLWTLVIELARCQTRTLM